MHYVIIGTDHRFQESESLDAGLRDLLQSIIRSYPVVLIAEETKTSKDVRTFGRDLIGDDKWLSIDMTACQKKEAGIYDILNSSQPEYDPVTGNDIRVNAYHQKSEAVREEFWLNRIAQWCDQHKVSSGTVVLTCGDNHLEFLAQKVAKQGHTFTLEQYLPFDKEAQFGPFRLYDD